LGLPDEFNHLFEGDEHSFYFIIWDRNGTILAKSKSVDQISFPDLHIQADGLPVRQARMREMHREVIHVSRFDINVLVGRSLYPDLAALHRAGLRLILTGLGVLAIGLAGGWWFSSRAIRPIAEMSAIAESISVKNLSTRINVESTATELEQLGTVLNRTFDRLQAAFERQGQFTADASHELRTPVAVILSHAELALSRTRSPADYQNAIQACRRAAMRMKSLIDSLLLLARFDSGEPEIFWASTELDRLVIDAVDMLQPLAGERQVTLGYHADPLTIDADHDRLSQVVTNLLTNAIRYNKPGGRVDVEVCQEQEFAVIRVIDTGVGIPPDELPRIFDRFYRVDKARSIAEGGSGLGLSICQTIVEAHRGTIRATSELNVGTTIEVRLPLAQGPSNPVQQVQTSAHEDSSQMLTSAGSR
jgi:heavy metal sensor kinase